MTSEMQVPIPELQAAEDLSSEIVSRADDIESGRRLPADLARKFAAAGWFRMAVPESYGGTERQPADLIRVIEAVSRADGSAGWCVMISATSALLSGYFPEATARAIYVATPDAMTGGAIAPTGKAVPVAGGYRVNGRWQWGSNTQNCQWIFGGALVMEGDAPRQLENGAPEVYLMVFNAADVDILDTWHASGLRGTGSHDFEVRDVVVPEDHTIILGQTPPVFRTPLYRFPFFGLLALGVCAVSLGIARRAIDEFIALATAKVPTWHRNPLAERATAQVQVAKAEAAVRSARALVLEATESAWEYAVAGETLPDDIRRDLRLAAVNAARQSAKAVSRMYEAGGGSSVHASNPLQRCFRDVHVTTQHIMVNAGVYEQTGRLYLGVGSASPLL